MPGRPQVFMGRSQAAWQLRALYFAFTGARQRPRSQRSLTPTTPQPTATASSAAHAHSGSTPTEHTDHEFETAAVVNAAYTTTANALFGEDESNHFYYPAAAIDSQYKRAFSTPARLSMRRQAVQQGLLLVQRGWPLRAHCRHWLRFDTVALTVPDSGTPA